MVTLQTVEEGRGSPLVPARTQDTSQTVPFPTRRGSPVPQSRCQPGLGDPTLLSGFSPQHWGSQLVVLKSMNYSVMLQSLYQQTEKST